MGAAEREALVRAYIAARRQLGDGLAGLIDRWFDTVRSFRDDDAARFVAQVVPAATGAQQATAALTWAFQARMLAEATGDPRPPVALETAAVTGGALRGVDMATVYRRPIVEIWRRLAEGADLAESVAAGRRRAQSIAATDLQLASTRTSREVMADPRSGRYYRRQLTGAENCGLCVLASTQRYNRGDLLPIHPGCVTEGTLVSGPESVKGTRRRYVGKGVVLQTASGDFLTITPNHPILTGSGWVPAGVLNEGDEIVRSSGGNRIVGGVPGEHHMPARIEDRFSALAMKALVRVPLAAEHFHGDGLDGHIGVIPADRLLWSRGHSVFSQPRGQLFLCNGVEPAITLASASDLAPLLIGMDASPSGFVRDTRLSGTFFGGHPRGAVQAGPGPVTDLMASGFDRSFYGLSGNTELDAQVECGLTCEIAGDDLFRNGSSRRTKFDAPVTEFAGKGSALHAERGRRLLQRLAGQVQLDRLVFVRRVDLSGHVYNLQTAEGWYSANGIIVSNCDCVAVPLAPGEAVDRVLDPELLEAAHTAIEDQFGKSDRGGRSPDYRKVVLVREHGELGPVLTVRRHSFTSAGDLPAVS